MTNTRKSFSRGFFSLLSSGFILACFGLLTRWLNQYVGDFMQVGMRMAIAIVLIIPYLIYKKISLKFKIENFPLFATFILSFPIYIIFFTISVNTTKVANAFFYLFLSSILTSYGIGYIYFREKFDLRRTSSLVLILVGLFSFVNPFVSIKWMGLVSGLSGGVFWGISNATRKYYMDRYSHWLVIFLQMIFGAILAMMLAYSWGEFQSAIWRPEIFLLASIFGVSMVFIQFLLFIGFDNLNLSLGSIVLASQLVFVQIFGVLLLNEFPTVNELMGMIVILIAIILTNLESKQPIPHFLP